MILNGNPVQSPGIGIQMRLPSFIKRISYLLVLLLIANATFAAEEPEEQFLQNYILIEKADSLLKNSQPDAAKLNYRKAQVGLSYLKKTNPAWKPKVVDYRLRYVTDKIAALTKPVEAPATSPAGTEGSAPGATASKGGLPSGMQIKVLEQGSEPRQVLRLQPKVGDTQKETMAMKISMDMGMGAPMSMPTITLNMDLTIATVAENGDITYDVVYGEATVADEPGGVPQLVDAIKAGLAGMAGTQGKGTLSSRGIYRSMEMKYAADTNPQLRQSMDQMKESMSAASSPLPEEAIGLGAKWEVKQPVKSQGMTVTQISTYELVSSENGQIVIKSTTEQSAANQKIQNAAMGGMKADVTKMTGHIAGNMTWDLARILPIIGTLDGHSELAMSVTVGNQKQPMTVKTDLKVQLEAK